MEEWKFYLIDIGLKKLNSQRDNIIFKMYFNVFIMCLYYILITLYFHR